MDSNTEMEQRQYASEITSDFCSAGAFTER
jgi:hypothetical protein